MSIIDSFDNKSKPLIDISAFYGEKKFFADVCIVSFSRHVLAMFLEKYESHPIGHSATANGHIDIYLFEVNGKKLLFYIVRCPFVVYLLFLKINLNISLVVNFKLIFN